MLIGLTGFAQSGKSTVAGFTGFEVVSFAEPLRRLLELVNPWVQINDTGQKRRYSEVLEEHGYEWAKAHTDARAYLIHLGDGARQVLGDAVWVNAGRRAITRATDDGHRDVVIPDVRYPNEAKMISAMGGEVWHIERPGVEAAHETEARSISEILQMQGVTRRIWNVGSLEHLEIQVQSALYRASSAHWDVV